MLRPLMKYIIHVKDKNKIDTSMKRVKLFEKFISESKITEKDFDKVVKALKKSKYPITVMFVSKWNEIDILIGMDAPDPIAEDIIDRLDKIGLYGNRDISISGDSSNYSRREYDKIERINGGHKDY